MNGIRLNPTLDAAAVRDSYAAIGRVRIPDVLVADSARAIHRALADSNSWQLSLNSSDRHVDLPTEQLELLPSAAQVLLVDSVNRSARTSFQYIFNALNLLRVPQMRCVSYVSPERRTAATASPVGCGLTKSRRAWQSVRDQARSAGSASNATVSRGSSVVMGIVPCQK